MEKDLQIILSQILENQKETNKKIDNLDARIGSMENRMSSIESRMDSLENKVSSIESRMDSLENKVNSIESRIDSLENKANSIESKVDKNTLIMENMQKNIHTIAEVLENHVSQNEKGHINILENVLEKGNLLELSIKDISKNTLDISLKEQEDRREIKKLKIKVDTVRADVAINTQDLQELRNIIGETY